MNNISNSLGKYFGMPLAMIAQLTTSQLFASALVSFNACTFTSNSFALQSFAEGNARSGCADWSVSRGRSGCKKTKGACPFCVVYPGDHLQMWLPEFFIELTTAPGESVFTVSSDGLIVKKHLELAHKYWKISTLSPESVFSRAQPDAVTNSMFWHARILAMPYANLMGSFTPLPGVVGTEAPTCFAGLSEFLPEQWNYNLIDAPYAFAYSSFGSALCNSPQGSTLTGGIETARGEISKLGLGKSFANTPGKPCARPVGVAEGGLKLLRPTSDALAPLSNPSALSSKLCMGSWGNLLPRTGYSTTGDTSLSAMQAAYKFASLVADLNLNDNYKIRQGDKFQIVFPRTAPGGCFKPGSLVSSNLLPSFEDVAQRTEHELNPSSERKGTYVIAVWRKRETCEEPLETVGGWSAAHKLHIKKNAALCSSMNLGGSR